MYAGKLEAEGYMEDESTSSTLFTSLQLMNRWTHECLSAQHIILFLSLLSKTKDLLGTSKMLIQAIIIPHRS